MPGEGQAWTGDAGGPATDGIEGSFGLGMMACRRWRALARQMPEGEADGQRD
jgi:hypothetical protein